MSTIREFYIEKEKRELINTIGSAKYVSEDQKEAMIAVMEDDMAHHKYGGDEEDDVKQDLENLKRKQKEYDYGDDEYEALGDRIDKKVKKLKDIRFRDSQQRSRDQERNRKAGHKIGIGGGLGS